MGPYDEAESDGVECGKGIAVSERQQSFSQCWYEREEVDGA